MQIYGAQPCGIALLLYPTHTCNEIYQVLRERYYAMRDSISTSAGLGLDAPDRQLVPGMKPGSRLTVLRKKTSSTPAAQAAADMDRKILSSLHELLEISACGGFFRLPGHLEDEDDKLSVGEGVGHDRPGHSGQGLNGQGSEGGVAAAGTSQPLSSAASAANTSAGGAGRGVLDGDTELAEAMDEGAAASWQAAAYLKGKCLPCPALPCPALPCQDWIIPCDAC